MSAKADELDRNINMERKKGTVYELLNRVSERSGMLFIYEKGVVNNDQRATIAAGVYTLRDAILQITGEKDLQLKVIDNHVLLYKEHTVASVSLPVLIADSLFSTKTIEGYVRERLTREAIPYCSILLEGTGVGTVTNSDGKFSLKIPDSLSRARISITHIGYLSRTLSLDVFSEGKPDIYLEPATIQLQDVVVRYVPAQKIVREMLDHRYQNYSKDPVYLTSFYREGVEYGGHFVSLTEAVCKIYKSGFDSFEDDQVKLLKMRHVQNPRYPDSLLVKVQAGVRTSLILDIIKHLPDFLTPERDHVFTFTRVGMEHIDSGMVHVVTFEQKVGIKDPLFTGTLYINADNWALLKAEFEINPLYIRQVGPNYVIRKSKSLDIEAQKIGYTISYQPWKEHYWIQHVRGDLHFKIKRKKSLFWSSKPLTVYFDMATCAIDDKDVKHFPNKERLSTGRIFSQTPFGYDADFWERFNTIPPEEQLTKTIAKLLLNIEEHP